MDRITEDSDEDADLRYTCPSCRRIFPRPTPNWLCPSCKGTLRILGALRLRDKRRGLPAEDDLGEEPLLPQGDEEDSGDS